jgi:hypothetical protein
MYGSTLSLTPELTGGGWLTLRPIALLPGRTRYPTYWRRGGPQARSGQERKNLAPTGIRSPDSLARSESLYRLSYTQYIQHSESEIWNQEHGEMRDNNMKIDFKDTRWDVVCSNSEI